jgi:exonuclease SbcD
MAQRDSIRILHTSDWHIGISFFGRSLLEDQFFVLKQIISYIKEHQVDALVISGDIFDKSIPSAEAVELLNRFFYALREEAPCTVLLFPGNHDSAKRLSYGAGFFKTGDIHIIHDCSALDKPLVLQKGSQRCTVHALPWIQRLYDVKEEGERESKPLSVESALKEIEKGLIKGVPSVLGAHLFTQKGVASDSERVYVGSLELFDPALFAKFSYTALGHLHRPQTILPAVRYSGSILAYSFGESDLPKSVTLVDIAGEDISFSELNLEPLRKCSVVKGSFTELLSSADFDSYEGDYVEAVLSDREMVARPADLLSRRFPYLLSVRQNPEKRKGSGQDIEFEKNESIEETYAHFYNYIHGESVPDERISLFTDVLKKEGFDETP